MDGKGFADPGSWGVAADGVSTSSHSSGCLSTYVLRELKIRVSNRVRQATAQRPAEAPRVHETCLWHQGTSWQDRPVAARASWRTRAAARHGSCADRTPGPGPRVPPEL